MCQRYDLKIGSQASASRLTGWACSCAVGSEAVSFITQISRRISTAGSAALVA